MTMDWTEGLDEATMAYVTDRGLADKEIKDALLDTIKAHKEAQAYIGVPKEQLLTLPKADAAPEEWDAVWEKLGYSKNADDYKFDGLKRADGTDVDAATKDHIRAQATALRLSPANALKLAEADVKFRDNTASSQTAETTAAAAKAMEGLRQSWGPNFEANRVIADRAYAAIMAAAGFDQPTMTATIGKLGELSGRAEVMQMLLAVGQRMGEDAFKTGGGPGPGGNNINLTKEQAVAKIAELKQDSAWTTRFLAGGTAEVRESDNLHQIAYGENA
jgi:hypothetical protein